MSKLSVVIVEDEKPAARRLNRMLEETGVEVLTVLHSVEESVQWLYTNAHPDLLFLDIQLSDGLSFEIFDELTVKSAIIFTTAYDEYALKAFKLNSVDYLLKPIDQEELEAAIAKFEERFNHDLVEVNMEMIKKLINPDKLKFKKRFTIKIGQHLKMIQVDKVSCFFSENKATNIHTSKGRDYVIEESLDLLEDKLSPELFFRVSRKYIVNINAISDIISYSNSRLKIQIQTLKNHEIIVSRERVKAFKEWIG
jgi:DNA-binding LytR/AlgR family response regulator